ncbi:MAG: DUF2339 domain-containing protein [Kiritimatiellae bacterium]|nr:DUF2339 domain-containing protein [Kiritimatiellia bacterium]
MTGALLLLFVLGLVGLPLALSIWALVHSSRLSTRLDELRKEMEGLRRGLTGPGGPPPLPGGPCAPLRHPDSTSSPATPPRAAERAPPSMFPPPPPATTACASPAIEETLGGRAAAWAGVVALMLGVAFFVVYAIQRAWLGPEIRVAAGVLAGAGMVVVGHRLALRPQPPTALARLLTGGGAGLLYYSVYAASARYGLLGPTVAFVALLLVSAAVFALASLYRSPVIAALAVLGAHGSPFIATVDRPQGLFVLAIVALINLPVLALIARHRWASLGVQMFALSWLQYTIAVGSGWSGLGEGHSIRGTAIAAILWAQVAASADRLHHRPAGALLALNSLALLGALAHWFDTSDLAGWFGTALLTAAVAHLGWALGLRRRLGLASAPVAVRLLAALMFAALALPAQLDGAWVSAGWILGGALIARFGGHLEIPLLRETSVMMCVAGLGKSLLYDATLYPEPPRLFLNARFAVSLLGAVALAGLGPSRRMPRASAAERPTLTWLSAALLAAAAAVWADVGWWRGWRDPVGAAITTATLVMLALAFSTIARRETADRAELFARALLLAAALKLVMVDLPLTRLHLANIAPFRAVVVWSWLGTMALAFAAAGRRTGAPRGWTTAPQVAALVAAIITVTLELARTGRGWRSSYITIWWVAAALALVIAGLATRRAHLRQLGLLVFTVATTKLFLLDIAALDGLHRVAAFLTAGTALVGLSYLYQSVARTRLATHSEAGPP